MIKKSVQRPVAPKSREYGNGFHTYSDMSLESGNIYRLGRFIRNGFQLIQGSVCHNYDVRLNNGVTEEELYKFLTNDLNKKSMPAVDGLAGGRETFEMLKAASDKGLVTLIKRDTVPSVNPPPLYNRRID